MNPSPELKVRIGGMHCASCVSRVESALHQVSGVKRIQVQLMNGMGLLEFQGNPDWNAWSQALKEGGYSIEPWTEGVTPRDWDSTLFPAMGSLILGTLLMVSMHGLPPAVFYPLGAVTAILVQVFWARPFILGTLRWLRGHGASMETLIGIGTLSALGLSLASPAHPYFEVSVFLVGFVRLGKWLESRAKSRTGAAIRSLIRLRPPLALRMAAEGEFREVSASELRPGDRVRILVGAQIPADGEVISGHSAVNEAWLTGESVPVEKTQGSKVLAGSQNGLGTLEMRVSTSQRESLLSQMIERVEKAQMSRAPIQRIADQVASWFIPVILTLAALTFLTWLILTHSLSLAILHAVSVLVIACPCALGLATPAALTVGLGKASRNGVLFKSGTALETLAKAKTFIFDKTGTLTQGSPSLWAQFNLAPEKSDLEWLKLAASVEQGSEHLLAGAFLSEARKQDLKLSAPEKFQALPGQGLRASVAGQFVLLGTERLMAEQGIILPESAQAWLKAQSQEAATPVILACDFKPVCLFSFKDPLQPGALELLGWLHREGFHNRLLSGDRKETARATGHSLGLEDDQIEAEVLPHQKEARVAVLEQTQGPVAMVGDGINDAAALARASVSVSLHGASETALDSAQVLLMSGKISDLRLAIQLARQTLNTIHQNLVASAIYNLIGIPLAAGVFEAGWGLALTPSLAGAAMGLSSLSVVLNSLRLRASARMNS
jgi:Cu+-exporting ATPase